MKRHSFDSRRQIIIPGDKEETIAWCVHHWIEAAQQAIADHGFFAVALSGGSTPKLIYQKLVENASQVDWSKVYLFWSDERSVPPTDPDSNYHMAMEAGLKTLPIPTEQIFRMVAETDIEENARAYDALIRTQLAGRSFDLIMLGVGEDGHTASLFPHTHALSLQDTLVTANEVPQKKTWRMSFTFPCINAAHHICLYLIGPGKADIFARVLTSPYDPSTFPSQKIGTPENPALWIADTAATQNIISLLK